MNPNTDPSVPAHLPRRGLRRHEYDALVAMGAFDGERVELLFGEIIAMSPQKPPHRIVSQRLGEGLTLALTGRAKVQLHSPIVGAGESEPEPDVAVYDPADDRAGTHPHTVHLAIEVAAATRAKDLGVKRHLYALTGIPEYWVVDLVHREVRVMREPSGDDYRTVTTVAVAPGARLTPALFPDVTVALDEVFEGV